MMQGRNELGSVLDITAAQGRPYIVHQHLANALGPMLLMKQVLSENRSGHFWQMLMFSNGGDFRLRQPAHANAVFEGNHLWTIPFPCSQALRQIKAKG